MALSIGTFNLNNLFSRYNFRAEVAQAPALENGGLQMTFSTDGVDVRTFRGNLVKKKDAADTATIAARIRDVMDADILAVQEVEHIEILKEFNRDHLGGLYRHVALIEGNDQRLIDVGFLSKRPFGAITSHQAARHPGDPNRRVFGRDLLELEILDDAGDVLVTLFNTHMKSHFVPHTEDPVEGAARANARRQRQAETTKRIIESRMAADSRYVLLGDMNDPPGSQFLAPMLEIHGAPLQNALTNPMETRPPKAETSGQGPGPQSPAWTHRFNPSGPPPPEYELYDQIWLSPALASTLQSAHIDRRTKHGGDGSDHDPAWVVLDL